MGLPNTFVTVTEGVRGWFAVIMDYDEECECHVPYNSSFWSYPTKEQAIPDAEQWARAEELPLITD